MPTPNYGYEKRQKELARKKKKEDKIRARAERKTTGDSASETPQDGEPAPDNDQGIAAPPAMP